MITDYPSLIEGVYLYTMHPWKNTKKVHVECTYRMPVKTSIKLQWLGFHSSKRPVSAKPEC
jgi:hypothetical protein